LKQVMRPLPGDGRHFGSTMSHNKRIRAAGITRLLSTSMSISALRRSLFLFGREDGPRAALKSCGAVPLFGTMECVSCWRTNLLGHDSIQVVLRRTRLAPWEASMNRRHLMLGFRFLGF
jgi:hypothetical protein